MEAHALNPSSPIDWQRVSSMPERHSNRLGLLACGRKCWTELFFPPPLNACLPYHVLTAVLVHLSDIQGDPLFLFSVPD